MREILKSLDDERKVTNTISLRPKLWKRLQDISDRTKAGDPRGKGHSRNSVIEQFLEWAADEYEKDEANRKKK